MADEDLTTLAAVREFLQKTGPDISQDVVISELITRASVAIMRYTSREFAPPVTATTRTFDYSGEKFLSLSPYDLRTVTSVRSDAHADTPTTLEATSYRMWPNPAPEGVYHYLKLDLTSDTVIEITGDWGFSSVPVDVEHACIVTVATWVRADVSAFSTTFRLDDERLERPEALPSAVVAVLKPWRPWIGVA